MIATNWRPGAGAIARGGPLELVGRTEAATILGVARTNLTTVVGLPAPVVNYLKCGQLWLRRDIERFGEERNGRRPKGR